MSLVALSADDQKFLQRIAGSLDMVQDWDRDVGVFQDIRNQIPWEELRNPTGKFSQPEDRLLSSNHNAVFVQRLARWFKNSMTWVNNPPCKECGSKETEMKTIRGPETEEEKEGKAGRVEVYSCPQCNADTTTFPRYNKAKKLLETKRGRCGEYANLFGCVCRAVGLETRLVLDFSDHVWTEVRLHDTWHMVDSCEGVIDKPSMYEHGWGKGPKLSYMIGIANDHVMDVTPRYSRNYITDDFQTRRRAHTSSEDASVKALQSMNDKLSTGASKVKRDEMARRNKFENAELQLCKQATEWTEAEKYGRGRISGSLAWKQSRSEAGKQASSQESESKEKEVATFEVESLCPPVTTATVSLQVHPNPTHHHDGIIVANTPCAIGELDSVSVVVVDEAKLGCILQSQSFVTWPDVKSFVDRLPSNRIVIMNGNCKTEEDRNDGDQHMDIPRLGGWKGNVDNGILFVGQVDAHPDWTFCSTLVDAEAAKEGYTVELQVAATRSELKLRTEKHCLPPRVAGRLPESAMPLQTQLLATEEQKRLAFVSFCSSSGGRYCGYTTKPKSPIYLLDSTSYPLSRMDTATIEAVSREDVWNTFHYLPVELVTEDDNGIISPKSGATIPKYDVPLDSNFFIQSLGNQLIGQHNARLPTADALQNARLIGLYFSAHWCGPCRQFTPMLAEMYEHLKEERPSHGLEIVFVSSDRNASSFNGYFATMPWLSIPFENLQMIQPNLSMTYEVRGIPSLVILDAVTGQVVVSAQESRQEVAMACRGGEARIEAMLDSWLARTPVETREILSMLELSCQEEEESSEKKKAEGEEHPYLIGQKQAPKQVDLAAEVKKIFEKLVAEGTDPTAAAAQAITLAAEEQKKGPKLEPGPLNGKAVRTGSAANGDALDEAFANAMVWNNPPEMVTNVLSTALKYVKNAIKEPWSPKFRTLKLSNKVADQITRVEGGLKLLQCLGFEVFATSQDFKAAIPAACDLNEMVTTIERLLEGLA